MQIHNFMKYNKLSCLDPQFDFPLQARKKEKNQKIIIFVKI